MKLQKIFIFIALFILIALPFCAFPSQTEVIKNTQLLQELFNQDKESLNYQQVVPLASQVIKKRKSYTNNAIAIAFVLLSDVAINQGDLDRAFQFSKDSNHINITNNLIKFRILQQLVLNYIIQGQYQLLLKTAQQAFVLTEDIEGISQSLIALSYRSVAYALLGQHQKSLSDLQIVEKHISENISFSKHIELLEILALANSYLGNFQISLSIQLDILKLRYSLQKNHNIEQTYYQLGEAYRQLNQLDDAFNAYNEAKQFAINKGSTIYHAYASKGLGTILFLQQEYQLARSELKQSKQLFSGQNLNKPYLETLIALGKVNLLLHDKIAAYALLKKAENIVSDQLLDQDKKTLYSLLAEMYFDQQSFKKAYFWQKKYSVLLTATEDKNNPSPASHIFTKENSLAGDKSKNLSIKLAQKSELLSYYSDKFKWQKSIINSLILSLITLTLVFMFFYFKRRNKHLTLNHAQTEKPQYHLATSLQTKEIYQSAFKKSRTFEYPLTVASFTIVNWQELQFHFNKKTMAEVNKTIAMLINEYLDEFDFAGIIDDGEYLLLFPHQRKATAEVKISQLEQAFSIRFFANLGDYSVNPKFVCATPTVLDIDPYVFLSQLLNDNEKNDRDY